jgi:hypothetical protein
MNTGLAVEAPKIDVKAAVNLAAEYFTSLFPNADNILLEEVELSDDRKHWFITLSYIAPFEESLFTIVPVNKPRKYKQFKIETETGQVIFMKIREVK